jgi:hypothetical protein
LTARPARVLTLLGSAECHLCHEMREVVLRVLAELGGELVERDIRDDPDLTRLYRTEIPVLLDGDREIARHRVSGPELRRRLLERAAG